MSDPQAPGYGNPSLPANWQGGVFDGLLEPLNANWWDEDGWAADDWIDLMRAWAALEDLTEGDPPGRWGFDVSSVGPGAGIPVVTEVLSGVVLRVAATGSGLVLEELPSTWLNVSRYAEGVTLAGVGIGDVLVLECERAGDRRYIKAIKFHQGVGE